VEATYTGLVQSLNELSGWLRLHTFMAIALLAIPSGAIVAMRNATKGTELVVGRTANVVAGAASLVVTLGVFLPFLVRSAAGASGDPVAAPACLARDSACAQAAQDYLRQFVPYSDVLAVATLCFFFATVIWYVAALVAALRS
jgi:hypothetical protein